MPTGLEKVTTSDLFRELAARTENGVMKADLDDLREQFDAQLSLSPPTATETQPATHIAPAATEAKAALSATPPADAPPSPVAPEAKRGPGVQVIVDRRYGVTAEKMAQLTQGMLLAYVNGTLSPIPAQLVRIAAELEMLALEKQNAR